MMFVVFNQRYSFILITMGNFIRTLVNKKKAGKINDV